MQTPREKDAKKLGCEGFLIYDVGSPSVTKWRCDWDNPVGEKNSAESKIEPQVPGLQPMKQWDQGDENLPFNFTLSSEDTGGKSEFTIGPFKVGKSDVLDSGNLEKTVYNILHKELSAETRDAILKGELAGGKKIEVHGYASNTDLERRNLNLSKDRAKAVISVFGKLGVPASVFSEPIPHGEYETANPTDDKSQEKEDPNERKVVLKIHVN